jgi:hypothetical protein
MPNPGSGLQLDSQLTTDKSTREKTEDATPGEKQPGIAFLVCLRQGPRETKNMKQENSGLSKTWAIHRKYVLPRSGWHAIDKRDRTVLV